MTFLDTSYPFRGVAGLPLLPRVYAPSMAVRRRPRRDNAAVALADHALLIAGRFAGPVAVGVLAFIITVALVTPRAVHL